MAKSDNSQMRILAAVNLLIILAATMFLSIKMMTVLLIVLFIFWFSLSLKIHRQFLVLILPLVFMLLIGSIYAWQHQPYNVLKDVWFVGKAILFITTGYYLMQQIQDPRLLYKTIIIAAVIASLYRLVQFLMIPGLLDISFIDMRRVVGSGNFNTVLGLITLYSCWVNRAKIFNKLLDISAFIICFLALASSYSRTYWVAFIIMFLITGGYFSFRKIPKLLIAGAFVILASFVLMQAPDINTDPEKMSFLEKMMHSGEELTVRDQIGYEDRNINWRGFEAWRGILTYLDGSTSQYIIGAGFGKLVDLGFYIELGSERMRYIPILHNGYIYILLKMGVIGVLVYVIFFLMLAALGRTKNKKNSSPYEIVSGSLLVSLSYMFLITTLVIAGLFSKSELLTSTVFLGSLIHIQLNSGTRKLPQSRNSAAVEIF